jgi:hypothetical protein
MIEPTGLPPSTPMSPPDQPGGAAFSSAPRPPRWWRVGIVAASGLILLVSAALALGASSSPPTGPDPSATGGSPGAGADEGRPFGLTGRLGLGGHFGIHRGPFGAITIAAIDGSNLSLKTDDGWTRTITIASSTKITKGGQPMAPSDLKVGDTIGFKETRQSDGTYSIDAIAVLLPRVAGSVGAVTADGFSVKTRDGTVWTITVNGSTAYHVDGATGTKSDVKTGVDVVVAGIEGSSEHTLTAVTVHVRLPAVLGEVTAKGTDTLTIKRPDGTSQTIHVDADTTYRVRGSANDNLSSITVGMSIVAQGTERADGSLDATRIAAGLSGRGLPGVGWRRFPPGLDKGDGPDGGLSASPPPSTPGSQG